MCLAGPAAQVLSTLFHVSFAFSPKGREAERMRGGESWGARLAKHRGAQVTDMRRLLHRVFLSPRSSPIPRAVGGGVSIPDALPCSPCSSSLFLLGSLSSCLTSGAMTQREHLESKQSASVSPVNSATRARLWSHRKQSILQPSSNRSSGMHIWDSVLLSV